MQQGILARITLRSRYRNRHDPTQTKTNPRCAEGYHPTRTKYELVGEHRKKMSSSRALPELSADGRSLEEDESGD
jgi:hypothetical protein